MSDINEDDSELEYSHSLRVCSFCDHVQYVFNVWIRFGFVSTSAFFVSTRCYRNCIVTYRHMSLSITAIVLCMCICYWLPPRPLVRFIWLVLLIMCRKINIITDNFGTFTSGLWWCPRPPSYNKVSTCETV